MVCKITFSKPKRFGWNRGARPSRSQPAASRRWRPAHGPRTKGRVFSALSLIGGRRALPKTKLQRKGRASGFALVEALFAVGITGLVMAALATVAVVSGRSFAALGNYVDLDDKNRVAIDQLTRDVRGSVRVISGTTNTLVLEDSDGTSLTYSFNPTTKTVSRTKSGTTTVLLHSCENFKFEMCLRTPKSGTYQLDVTSNPSLCKVINVSWVCSRSILGVKQNTESVQTARIVIRKQGS